jgi:hypothetical protein
VPEEYRAHLGRVTTERTIPQLRAFVEAGGTIVAIGSSAANLAAHFQLPIENHLVENGTPLPRALLRAGLGAAGADRHGTRSRPACASARLLLQQQPGVPRP